MSGAGICNPSDPDWCQVNETVRMLNLAVAQISMAMHEGGDSVDSLASTFGRMVESIRSISVQAAEIECPTDTNGAKAEVLHRCDAMQSDIQESLVAFQFYDRLSQRLDHVRSALERLSSLVGDPQRLCRPDEWSALQNEIRSRYSMREEQEMFDALQQGASVEEALALLRTRTNRADADELEMF
jgi:hypothetical protein